MNASTLVRPARTADAVHLASIQVASWRSRYAGLIPAAVLAQLTSPEAENRWRDQWHKSVANPPTSRHRVLVAVASSNDRRPTVAGFTSFGPATDPGLWPQTDAELYELRVHPEHVGQGHGSRLLNATAGTVADDGFHTLCAWALEADTVLLKFLESAGWARDGARRELDMGAPVPEVRLHAAITA